MAEKKFVTVVELVKSQLYCEKLLKKVSVKEALPNLSLLMQKYPWIGNPVPTVQTAQGTAPKPREIKPKYRVVAQLDQPKQQPVKQQAQTKTAAPTVPADPKPPARQTTHPKPQPVKQAPVQQEEPSEPQTAKFDPKQQENNPDDDRAACSFCGRKFAADRIETHKRTCAENPAKKAKKRQPVTFKPTMQ